MISEAKKSLNKYLFAKGLISIKTLVATFKRNGLELTPENLKWIQSEEGKLQAIRDYEIQQEHLVLVSKARQAEKKLPPSFLND